jgi:cytochrome P450
MVDLDFAAMLRDPYPYFAALRAQQRWAWAEPLRMYQVTRYDDVVFVDKDPETFSVQIPGNLLSRTVGTSMIRLDGDAHHRVQSAGAAPLKRRAVDRHWGTMIAGLAADIVGPLRTRDSAELMRDVAAPLTGACLREVLGLLDATAADIERWSTAFIAGLVNNADDPAVWAAATSASDEVRDCVLAAIGRVRAEPDGSVVSAMAAAHPGDPLSTDEIAANIRLMISGGFNDARDAVATLAWLLMAHPDAAERTRGDAAAFDRAFDESVRWLTPIGSYPRIVTRDVSLPSGDFTVSDRLLVIAGAANHDEAKFPDPQRFDIDRPNLGDHLAFSTGVHYCLGAQLARGLARAAVPAILDLPGIRPGAAPEFYGWQFRGPLSVPVTLTPATASRR